MKIMKRILYFITGLAMINLLLVSCKKDLVKTTMQDGIPPTVTLSPSNIVLTNGTSSDSVETVSWTASDYGFSAAVKYTVQLVKGGAGFTNPQQISAGNKTSFKFLGSYLNSLAIALGIPIGTAGQLDFRIKSALSDELAIYSDVVTLTVTPFQTAYPALLVQGGNSWSTPSSRTDGYLLTSPDYSSKYEGYLYLPNSDGWGGDAFKLVSTTTGTVYGWGSSSTTMSVNGGNLWLTPAPNYMKVNADVNALTINFTPANFFISGDDNGWSTSATPMTFNQTTNKWEANNVSLTGGKAFAFTANGGWDLNYKVDGTGKLIYGGPPAWTGNNIPIPATGVFKVILDLSPGNGSYTYSIQ